MPPSHCSVLHSPCPPGLPQGSGCEMHNQCNIHGLNFFFFPTDIVQHVFFFFFLCVFSPHFAFNLFVTCRHSTLCGYLFIYCLCLKPPPLKICISFLVFGLHSYNLFLHFFFLRCGGCTEAVVNVKQNKTSLLKFEHAFECYLNYFSLLEMLNGDVIRRSHLVPVLFI